MKQRTKEQEKERERKEYEKEQQAKKQEQSALASGRSGDTTPTAKAQLPAGGQGVNFGNKGGDSLAQKPEEKKSPTLQQSLADSRGVVDQKWMDFIKNTAKNQEYQAQQPAYTMLGAHKDANSANQKGYTFEQYRNSMQRLADEKKAHPYNFQNQRLQEIMDDTVAKIKSWRSDTTGRDLEKDAHEITQKYYEDMAAAYNLNLFDDPRSKDPVGISQKRMADNLEYLRGQYAANGKSPMEIKSLLDQSNYMDALQVMRGNKQNIQDFVAQNVQGDWTPEQKDLEKQAAGFETVDAKSVVDRMLNGEWYNLNLNEAAAWQEFMRDPENQRLFAQGDAAQITQRLKEQNTQKAADLRRQKGAPTYEQADAYLTQHSDVYDLTKLNPGHDAEYAALYNQLPAIFEKVWANGAGSLTDMERDVYQTALNTANNPEMNYALLNGDREKALPLLAAFGKAKAQEVQGMSNNMFAQYDPTPYQRALREAYLNTPEGAKEWEEEAIGTEYEQEAKDNAWHVERAADAKDLQSRPDFEELAKVNTEYADSALYRRVNGLPVPALDASNLLPVNSVLGGYPQRGNPGEDLIVDGMTDLQKDTFNAYYRLNGPQEAIDYLESLQYELGEKLNQKQAEAMQNLGEQGAGGAALASVLSVPMSVMRGAGYLDIMLQNLRNQVGDYQPVNYNGLAQLPGNMADAGRQGVMNQVDWNVNVLGSDVDLFDFLYGTTMSGADSMAAGAAGPWAGAALLGTGAAQSTAQDLAEADASDRQIVVGSTLAGAFETLFEHLSIGAFYDEAKHLGKRSFGEAMKNIFAQAGINFSEEFTTELADMVMEEKILGSKSKTEQQYKYLTDMGVKEETARDLIAKDKALRLMEAGFGGALMGGAFGSISNITSDMATNSYLKGLGKAVSKDARAGLQELAANLGGDAAKLAGKYNPAKAGNVKTGKLMEAVGKEAQGRAIKGQGAVGNRTRQIVKQLSAQTGRAETAAWGRGFDAENATDQETGALLRQIFKDLPEAGQLKATVRQAVAYDIADQITALGGNESRDSALKAADALASLFAGEELSNDQIQALAGSEGGMALMRQMMGGETANHQQALGEVEDVPGLEDAPIDADQAEGQPGVAPTTPEGQPIPGGTREDAAQPGPEDMEKQKGPAPDEQRREGEAKPTTPEGQPIPGGTREDAAQPGPEDMEKQKGPAPDEQRREGEAPTGPVGQPIPGGTREDRAQATPADEEKQKGPKRPETRVKIKNPDGGESTERDVTFKKTDDGLVAVDADGGETAADDLELSPAQQKVINLAEGMEDEEAANDMISTLQGETDPETAGQNALAFIGVQKQAARGVSLDQSGSLFGNLTPAQKQAAWQAGRRQYEAAQADTRMRTQEAAKRDGVRTIDQAQPDETGLYYAGVTKPTTPAQKVHLRLLNQFARQNGLQILVYDTLGSANGAYRTGSNVISIALDAEGGGLTRAASHEGYHYIMDHDKEAGQKIRDFVVEQLKKTDGYNLDERIAQVKQQYRDAAGQELTDDMALEEIIADSMLDMIGTQDNLKSLAQKGSGVLEQIRAWLEKTLAMLRRIVDRFAQNSPEAAALKDQTEWFEQLRTMYDEALQNIKRNGAQAQQALYKDIKGDESVAAYQQDLGAAVTPEDREGALNGLLTDLFNRIERPWIEAHPDEYEQGYNNFLDGLRDFGQGKTNSLAHALGTRRLNVPGNAENNMLLTYAARQMVEMEQRAQAAAAQAAAAQAATPPAVVPKGAEPQADAQAGAESPETRLSLRTDAQQQETDIAESVREDADLYAQAMQDEDTRAAVEAFGKVFDSIKGMTGDKAVRGAWRERLNDCAVRIKRETGSTIGQKTLEEELTRLFNGLDEGRYDVGEFLLYARSIAKEVLGKAPGETVPVSATTKDVLNVLQGDKKKGSANKGTPFYLTDEMKEAISREYGSVAKYTQKNFGKLRIRKQAEGIQSLAQVWAEKLNPLAPDVFNLDVEEADMPAILDAWLENSGQKVYTGTFGANIEHYATSLGLEMLGDYLDAPWTNTRVRNLTEEFGKARKDIVNHYRDKYQERMNKYKEAKEVREEKQSTIGEIRRAARKLNNMTLKGTDSRHVPEELRGAIETFSRLFLGDRAVYSGDEAKDMALTYAKLAADGALHDTSAAAKFDPDIKDKLDWLAARIGGKALRQMTVEELNDIRDVVMHFDHLVEKNNKEFTAKGEKKVDQMAGEMFEHFKARKEAKRGAVASLVQKMMYAEMTPYYYGKYIGGPVQDLINDLIIDGQQKYGMTTQDAKGFAEKTMEKYHVNDWIYSDNLRFETQAGDTIELTKQQAMTLYAWWEREKRNRLQQAAHLRLGGFTYNTSDKETRKLKGVDLQKSHVLSQSDMNVIADSLTEEQKAFVADMVEYLSKTLGAKGNEASMAMFGWKKFGENWYFPYTTDATFRGKNSTDAGGAQQKQIKNWGASKKLTERAKNPLKIADFTQIWAQHVDEMAMYYAFAEKLDNLGRITNYVSPGEDFFDHEKQIGVVVAPISMKKEMERAYGVEAVRYLEQLIKDVNGGMRSDERGIGNKMFSLFKKGSVAANLSVVLQQPSAYTRAMSMVSPRYFLTAKKTLIHPKDMKEARERMYKNSGVAVLKNMGRFDTNVGKSSVDWVMDSLKEKSRGKQIRGVVDEWTGKAAEKADEITWTYMYVAIENEIDALTNYERGTKDFDQAVGQRFNEVMTATQVYDSTLAKSNWMRSTSVFDKMATSFSAEPTLTFNMLMDSVLDVAEGREGAGRHAARTAAVFFNQVFVNSLLKSVATAFRRKKEEGTTWLEKYLSEFAGNFLDDFSLEGIAGMVPYARDIVSLCQGFDVERADMSVVSELIEKGKKVQKDQSNTEAWMNLAGAVGNVFGIPLRNVLRDWTGIWNNTFGGGSAPLSETSWRDILLTTLDTTTPLSFIDVWDESNKGYYSRMEKALIAGDMKGYDELYDYLTDTKQVKGDSITKAIKEGLADSLAQGLISDDQALKIMQEKLGMTDQKAFEYLDKRVQKAAHGDDEDYDYSKYAGIIEAVKAGKDVKEEAARLTEHGTKAKAVEDAIKDGIKELYLSGDITKAQVEEKLKQYLDITEKDDIYWLIDKWEYNNTAKEGDPDYSKYIEVYEAVKAGKPIETAMKEMTDHGYEEKKVLSEVESQIGEWYRKGEMDKATAEKRLKQYISTLDENGLYWLFEKWDANKAGNKEYKKNDAYDKAIKTGENLIQETKRYLEHGVEASTLAGRVTEVFKPLYIAAYEKGDKVEMANIQARALTAYEQLGKKRSDKQKDIADWIKQYEKQKTKDKDKK